MTEGTPIDPIAQACDEAFDAMFDAAFDEWEQEDIEQTEDANRNELIAKGIVEEGIADMFEVDTEKDLDVDE